jgi:hypothetical protein
MNDVALKRRIAALMVAAFLSVMGATLAAVTVAGSADARPPQCPSWKAPCGPGW